MKNAANDNEELSFVSLAASTANVVRWLEPHEKKDEESGRDTDRSSKSEKDPKADLEYVEHRLCEISAREKRINGWA
jgi:hypothetical protein